MAEKKKTIIEKLSEIQRQLKAPKNLYNKFGGYNYRNAESILEALKPYLAETGTALTLSDEIVTVGDRFYVKATAELLDCEDMNTSVRISAYAREDLDKKGMDGSQITGAASSYARKYALNGLFLLDDTKDADTDEYQKVQGKEEPKKQKPKAEKPAEAPAEEQKPAETPQSAETPHEIGMNQPEYLTDAEVMIIRNMALAKGVTEQAIMDRYRVTDLHQMTTKQYAACMGALKKSKTVKIGGNNNGDNV